MPFIFVQLCMNALLHTMNEFIVFKYKLFNHFNFEICFANITEDRLNCFLTFFYLE